MKAQILLINLALALLTLSCQLTNSDKSGDNMLEIPIDTKAQNKAIEKLDAPIRDIVNNIKWYGQACVSIKANDKVIYVDPYNLSINDEADIILITHSHSDHLSISDIKKIATDKTLIYAPAECSEKMSYSGINGGINVELGQDIEIEGLRILAVPAYNTNKPHHPKSNNWLGYVLTVNGVKIYHPGDTDRIPEMSNIDCDITFMPLGQTYTMESVEEAANAVLDVKAEVAIPFHFGMYEGTVDDALKFSKLLEGKVTVILKNY